MNYRNFRKEELIQLLCEMDRKMKVISHPKDVLEELKPYASKDKEHFIVITLDGASKVINTHCVTIGLANRTLVHPREVFRPALIDNATSIIIAHNHPSGSLKPSQDDIDVTHKIINASEIIGIQVFDHIIVSKMGMHSMCEHEDVHFQ